MITPVIVEAYARAAHEVNRAYCITHGDSSQLSWVEAPDWQRDSSRQGVAMALAGATPEETHESWVKEKIRTGWRYGPVKDAEKKEHPCIRAYAGLSEEQRRKDDLYLSVVRAMAKALA